MCEEPRNVIDRTFEAIFAAFESPAVWLREKIVVPNQQNYPWYHEKFRRVPTIDQCYTDDPVCIFEAESQYQRDRLVESEILSILRARFEDCVMYQSPDHKVKCKPLLDHYEEAATEWFVKYGDLGYYNNVQNAYMKQKHRMIWERRHGAVGSGMKQSDDPIQEKE